ncbi:ester cyclase [Streptomyces cinnamoneus]|uniref:Ester cyclase n=1 Tax=Streptomyces cinnamoneus TaxID=53446 RepID=A0A2G1XC77_STRCJ|nr:ester cyclase [Streptomyces cinnamoneus]PHQ48818.1 ester cyclase [Streptomyces cinnamoneus]PPT14536.1 ester cyclase [Streptomyces cinnamoneus]
MESGKQVVGDFFQAVNERRVADFGRYLAADVVDHNKIIHGEADEPGAAFDGFRQQLDAFGEFTVVPRQLVAEGDTVVARVVAAGTHTGHHPRMPEPTGRSFEVEQIWIFTVRAGRIAEIRAVSDRLGMFLQLGWDWPTAG